MARKSHNELALIYRDKAVPTQLYFIETLCAERHVKIGVASNVRARMRKMQQDCPYTLRLIKRVPDSAHIEAELHLRFNSQRLGGEWFTRSDELDDFIASLSGSEYLETNTNTKPGLTVWSPFPSDDRIVRSSSIRPGVRNTPVLPIMPA